jgi:peptidoglycan L-alanyl-D-glutamate endopeptidase CwlK
LQPSSQPVCNQTNLRLSGQRSVLTANLLARTDRIKHRFLDTASPTSYLKLWSSTFGSSEVAAMSKAIDERHEEALATLHPAFKLKVNTLLHDLRGSGWQPVLVYGRRTEAQQKQKIAEGTGGKHSWHVTSTKAQLWSYEGNSVEVVRGSAADIVDRRWAWGGPCADKNHKFWKDLGRLAKKLGLEWGGDWKKRDVAHVQMKYVESPPSDSTVV